MKTSCEILHFLPLEIPGKTKLHPWKFYKIVLDPLKISRPKTKSPENSTLFFFGHPWKFQFVFNYFLEIPNAPFLIPQEIPYPCSHCLFFFWSCHEYPSHMHQMFKVSVAYRRIILLSMASFSVSHLRRIKKIFLINFSVLQQKNYLIFKLLNSTQAACDSYKSYD